MSDDRERLPVFVAQLVPSRLRIIRFGRYNRHSGRDLPGYTEFIFIWRTLLKHLCLAALCATFITAAFAQQAITTKSGLIYQSLKEGTGTSPRASDVVKVHYRGTFPDGREFDSSYKRGEPTEFPLNRVIPCWTEGVQMMKPGGKARLTCPPSIAYGTRGAGGVIPPNATLDFEIELLEVKR